MEIVWSQKLILSDEFDTDTSSTQITTVTCKHLTHDIILRTFFAFRFTVFVVFPVSLEYCVLLVEILVIKYVRVNFLCLKYEFLQII